VLVIGKGEGEKPPHHHIVRNLDQRRIRRNYLFAAGRFGPENHVVTCRYGSD
jgi:hypothetical protein